MNNITSKNSNAEMMKSGDKKNNIDELLKF